MLGTLERCLNCLRNAGTSRHVTWRHVISRHVTSRHVISRHVTSRHVTWPSVIRTPLIRSPARLQNRQFSSSGDSQLLDGDVDRYGGVSVDLRKACGKPSLHQFSSQLHASLSAWRAARVPAVWLHVPLRLAHLIPAAAEQGFAFHHTDPELVVMNKWLDPSTESRLPAFVTHQMGVAGVAIREDTNQVLVVKDRLMRPQVWKFPGGVADLGEDIADTAVREVFEETGVQTEFRSVLAFRQQHDQPGTFGRSDIYIVCRMSPLTTQINACAREVSACAWLGLDELEEQIPLAPITQRFLQLIRRGLQDGFHTIDLERSTLKSVYKGKTFQIYHRPLPEVVDR